jgi:cystathionine beta-synthase
MNILFSDASAGERKVEDVMGAALPVVAENTTLDQLARTISKEVPAVLVKLNDGKHHIVTKHDLIAAIG